MTIITCNLMGGLGNQLFQIFTTISYAIEFGYQFKFTNAKQLGSGATTVRSTFWDSLLWKLKPFTTNGFSPTMTVVREESFRFQELKVNPYYDTMIFGYFQSYKYFENNVGMICRMIGLEMLRSQLLKKMKYESMTPFKDMISLHFRLGDYKKIQNVHPVLSKEYYEEAIRFIQDHKEASCDISKIMFFCEDGDLEEVMVTIHYLSNLFPTYHFVRGENTLDDWEQLLWMSCCHHNVIANSSFSWWAAYFNIWEDKIVCYPSVWFGPDAPHDTSDLCPETWTRIRCLP